MGYTFDGDVALLDVMLDVLAVTFLDEKCRQRVLLHKQAVEYFDGIAYFFFLQTFFISTKDIDELETIFGLFQFFESVGFPVGG